MSGRRLLALLLSAFVAGLSVQAVAKTKVLFAFDMEDFVHPESADSVMALARTLEAEGVKGHFSCVGYFGYKLVERRRFDVLDALKKHLVGTQTLYHSLHPNITEYTDIEDYAAARERAMRDECEGIGMLKAATGHDRLWTSVLPGDGNTVVALYLYADLGIPFFLGGSGMYDDVSHCGDVWFCNQRHLTYSYEFRVEALTPGLPPVDVPSRLDQLAKRKVAVTPAGARQSISGTAAWFCPKSKTISSPGPILNRFPLTFCTRPKRFESAPTTSLSRQM